MPRPSTLDSSGASTLQARIEAEQREKEKEANIRSLVTRSSRASSSGHLSSDGGSRREQAKHVAVSSLCRFVRRFAATHVSFSFLGRVTN